MAYVPIKSQNQNLPHLAGVKLQRGFVFGAIMVAALAAFELFNFGTTEYALHDLLGGIEVFNVGWASILAVAFCAIDFAGLARLFTPEKGRDEPKEVWYLMGAWFLGACANAMMTWWAVTLALLPRQLGNEILSRDQLLTIVPIFVAALVWLTRILIIGTFGVAGERVFTLGSGKSSGVGSTRNRPQRLPSAGKTAYRPYRAASSAPSSSQSDDEELVYEPVSSARPANAYQPSRSHPPYGATRPAPKPRPTGAPASSYGYSAAPNESKQTWGYNHPTFNTGVQQNWLHRTHEGVDEMKT